MPDDLKTILTSSPIILAPMAGYTDRALRHILLEHKPNLITFTEMISTEGLIRDGKKTLEYLALADNEQDSRRFIQLFGYNPDSFETSIKTILDKGFHPLCFDINAGCSVKKVIKTGSGVALMRDLGRTSKIIESCRRASDGIPISIKFRLGWDENNINYLDFAKACIDSGADLLSLHPRTRTAAFSGVANHTHTKLLKEKFPNTLIIASGDIFSLEDAMLVKTSSFCDGIMIARGLIKNPYIFEGKDKLNLNPSERFARYNRHRELLAHYEGDRKAEYLIRKFEKGYLCKNDMPSN